MNVLGINYSGLHDSAAALAIDGRIVYAIAEERLSRRKQDASFPLQAMAGCLKFAGIEATQVDAFIVSWPPMHQFYGKSLRELLTGQVRMSLPGELANYVRSLTTRATAPLFSKHHLCPPERLHQINHHFAHALSVFPYLQQPRSLVFVLDGRGARESTSVYLKEEEKLRLLFRAAHPNSLGNFYAEITAFCGFKRFSEEWKLMGLAAYGTPRFSLHSLLSFSGDHYRFRHRHLAGADTLTFGTETLHRRQNADGILEDKAFCDLACSAQHHYEQFLQSFVSHFITRYGIRSIGITGGVGLNCKANGKLQTALQLEELFIQPAASDDGTALGAALYPFYQQGNVSTEVFSAYLGNHHTDAAIERLLADFKIPFQCLSSVEKDAALELSQGRVIGWFQGRDEFGPRALGNRSILADPRQASMRDKVNACVKYRELWRPFAPSILQEHIPSLLRTGNGSAYMTLAAEITPDYADRIPAVVHIDQTLRPHSVDRQTSPRFWTLIHEFHQLTGIPAVLNTSFNCKEEPLVSSPQDALRTFFTSGLDVLYLANYKIDKTRASLARPPQTSDYLKNPFQISE